MKRVSFLLAFFMVVCLLATMVGCASNTPSATTPAAATTAAPVTSAAPTTTAAPLPPIKLKYADQNPPTGWEGTKAAQPFLAQITAATNGRVQFETYFSQSLFKGTDAWVSVKNGLGDMAWMFHGYWANQTTLSDVLSLPLMPFTSAKQASGIFWQLYEKFPTLRDQYKDNQVLLTFCSQPYFLITTKKQVKTLDDVKGMQIRVVAGPSIDYMKALGAAPVTKAMPDTYISLQKGEIDGMAVPWEALLSFRQYEVVKYYTYMPMFTVYFTIAMNKDKWNSLPRDVQDQIMSVSGLKGSLFWGENKFDTAMAEGRDLVKKQGLEMIEYTMPESELNKFSAAAQPLWDAWVKKMTDAGHPEAKEILATTLELIKTYKP
ncbi:MAG TPA: TRAP transporter substrate-binding protein [Dehalococcoidales bacterium]|nr:TRAP transporter substrate-binding protein [Dehalococcoidales bacterium]